MSATIAQSPYGALTTTFTPAPACTDNFYTNRANTYYSIGGPSASSCFPSGWASTSQYFSPGVCPQGYTEACASISASQTFATCCPTSYGCYTPSIFNFVGQACVSLFTNQTTRTVTDGSALTTMVATLRPKTEAVNGYGVSIRYKAADFSSASSSSSSSGPSSTLSTSTSITSSTTSSSPSSSTTAVSSSSGLSTGARAGVGVGIAAVVLIALIALGMFIMKRRRSSRAGRLPDYAVHEADSKQRSYFDGKQGAVHEVYTPPMELDGTQKRPLAEM